MRVATVAILLALVGCTSAMPPPSEIPIGGVRAEITRENRDTARDRMPGGLVEPGWLPAGFALVHADYLEVAGRIESVDLAYEGPDGSLHIWQTTTPPDALGDADPVSLGEPIGATGWKANPLPEAQTGRPGVVEYSTRRDDGRTVTVDTDLDRPTVLAILEALTLRAEEADES